MANELDLATIWEWDSATGDPFIPPNDSPNARYCPTIEEMKYLGNSRNRTGDYLKGRLLTFMASNETRQTTYFDCNINEGVNGIRIYLTLIRSLHLKKISLEYIGGGKLKMCKLSRDILFTGEPDGIVNRYRISRDCKFSVIADDINHNALLGWLGPGTYPCWSGYCTLCTQVGRSLVVSLGPHGQLQLTKRAYCYTRNSVYVGVCKQCEEEGSFACYFGETRNKLNFRCKEHSNSFCNNDSIFRKSVRFPTIEHKRAEIARVIAAGDDPEHVLRDLFSHMTERGVHPGKQQMSVVDIIPYTFLRQNRERNLVADHMLRNGNFDFIGKGRG